MTDRLLLIFSILSHSSIDKLVVSPQHTPNRENAENWQNKQKTFSCDERVRSEEKEMKGIDSPRSLLMNFHQICSHFGTLSLAIH